MSFFMSFGICLFFKKKIILISLSALGYTGEMKLYFAHVAAWAFQLQHKGFLSGGFSVEGAQVLGARRLQ